MASNREIHENHRCRRLSRRNETNSHQQLSLLSILLSILIATRPSESMIVVNRNSIVKQMPRTNTLRLNHPSPSSYDISYSYRRRNDIRWDRTTRTTTTTTTTSYHKLSSHDSPSAEPSEDDISSPPSPPITIGFIGCGTIASSIARGLLTQTTTPLHSITVTKRSESQSAALKRSFPDKVTIIDDDDDDDGSNNQDVVDASDIIFLCVLPQQVPTVLERLTFDERRHVLVSLVSTATRDELMRLSSGLDSSRVFRMICLPSVARCEGVCLMCPKTTTTTTTTTIGKDGDDTTAISLLKPLFDALGGCVECETEDSMTTMMVVTGLMGPMYAVMKNNADFLVSKGIPPEDANFFVRRIYDSMIYDANNAAVVSSDGGDGNPKSFDHLIAEQTPGGLNEQAIANMETLRVFEKYDAAMEALLERLKGKSDGFI